MLSFQQAFDLVLHHARTIRPGVTENLELADSLHRILAQALIADRDQPPFHRSTRDGYAVQAASFSSAKVIGFLPAGTAWSGPSLQESEAIEIMTGAPLPSGTDAVVMLEHIHREGNSISLSGERLLLAGENIVPAGSEARSGQTVIPSGTQLTASEIGLAASIGATTITAFRKPSVAILATGDELVPLGQHPQPHQIRNSNTYALAALVEENGGTPHRLAIANDTKESLLARLTEARHHDLILLSGGVSAGKHDLVEEVLSGLGAEFFFSAVAMQPGKPAVFGRLPNGPYFFGLPGNPVSTQVTFLLFSAPLLRALAGSAQLTPLFVQATTSEPIRHKVGLTRFLPARLESTLQPTVKLVPWQGSGDLTANARANCYAVLPAGREFIPAGETVTLLLR